MSLTAPGRALRRHRFAQAGTLSVALALALTACGGQSEPAESSTTSPSSAKPAVETSAPASTSETAGVSSSPTATESEAGEYVPASADGPAQNVPKPEMPAAMKEETKEGAEAAIRYFWEATYFLQQTGESQPLQEVSGKTCKFCEQYKQSMTGLYENDGWMSGDGPSITSMATQPSTDGYITTLLIDLSPETARDSKGKILPGGEVSASPESPWIAQLSYSSDLGHWVVDSMTLESPAG